MWLRPSPKPGRNRGKEQPIRCSNCGEKLIKGAKFCDICGHPCASPEQQAYLKKRARVRMIILIIVGVILLLLVCGFFGFKKYLDKSSDEISKEQDLSKVEAWVSPEEYEKLELGMSLEEVEEIIGGKGKKMYESELRIQYDWPGEEYIDDNFDYRLTATFNKEFNVLTDMEENNVVYGKKAREFDDMRESGDYSGLDTVTVKKKQFQRLEEGMSYSEVASILGGEGLLISEERDTSVNGSPYEVGYLDDIEERLVADYAWKCILKKDQSEWAMTLAFKNGELYFAPEWDILALIE